jgi:hypothetical protein
LLLGTVVLLWSFPLDPRRVGVVQRRIAARRNRVGLGVLVGPETEKAV